MKCLVSDAAPDHNTITQRLCRYLFLVLQTSRTQWRLILDVQRCLAPLGSATSAARLWYSAYLFTDRARRPEEVVRRTIPPRARVCMGRRNPVVDTRRTPVYPACCGYLRQGHERRGHLDNRRHYQWSLKAPHGEDVMQPSIWV